MATLRQILVAILGAWLMAAPSVLGYGGRAADVHRVVGPLVLSFAVIAIWEATRGVRWVNVGLGAWLIVAPAILGYEWMAAVNGVVCGALIGLMSWKRGRVQRDLGGGWRSLWSGGG